MRLVVFRAISIVGVGLSLMLTYAHAAENEFDPSRRRFLGGILAGSAAVAMPGGKLASSVLSALEKMPANPMPELAQLFQMNQALAQEGTLSRIAWYHRLGADASTFTKTDIIGIQNYMESIRGLAMNESASIPVRQMAISMHKQVSAVFPNGIPSVEQASTSIEEQRKLADQIRMDLPEEQRDARDLADLLRIRAELPIDLMHRIAWRMHFFQDLNLSDSEKALLQSYRKGLQAFLQMTNLSSYTSDLAWQYNQETNRLFHYQQAEGKTCMRMFM